MATVTRKVVPNGNGRIGTELGLTGLRQWYGRIDEEILTELKWDKALKIYREMGDNDPTIGAAFNAITWLIRQIEWRVEGEDAQDEDERIELIESCMGDMTHSWSDLMAEIARGTLQYGWQAHEIVYKLREEDNSRYPDGLVGWKRLPVRAQDTLHRWDFSDAGELLAMVQRPAPDFKERRLPINKLLLFRTESFKDNPEGRSVLRNAYRPWYFKKHLENIEAIGLERRLAGLPIVWGPARILDSSANSADLSTRDYLEKMATGIRKDEQWGVVMPLAYDENGNKLYDLTLLATGGESEVDTSKAIERYDLRILQLMLADFIQVGHEKVGSFALADNKTNLFSVAIGVFLDQIATVFNRKAIPSLLELNGMETEDAPELKHGDIESRDLMQLADYLSKLSGAGMPLFPNPKMEGTLLELAKLPVPTPEEMAERDAAIEEQQDAELDRQMTMAEAGKPADKSEPKEEKPAPTEKRWEPQILKVEPQVTIHQGAVTYTPPNITTGGVTVMPSPTPNVVMGDTTIEAAKAPDVHVSVAPAPTPDVVVHVAPGPAPSVTIEAASPPNVQVDVAAPVVHNEITNPKVEVFVQPSPPVVVPAPIVTVEAPIVKQGDTIVQVDMAPLVEAIGDAADKLKRPDSVTITLPDGKEAQVKPTDG